MNKNFTKNDLKDGMVVQYRNGWYRVVLAGCTTLGTVCSDGYETRLKDLSNYNDDLTTRNGYHGTDIMKVFNVEQVLWERKEIKLSDTERAWLIVAQHDGKKYIARDEDGSVCVYNDIKPHKNDTNWTNGTLSFQGGWRGLFESANNLFQFISWTDDEPYLIEELLKL